MFITPAMYGSIGFPNGLINSIQAGNITIAANSSSKTATVSSVNTSKAVIFYDGFYTANTAALDASQQYVRLSLTNSTTVTAQTAAADASNARTASFTLVEFSPWCVKSVQSGTIVLNGVQSNTATITSVSTANSVVLFQGQTHSTNSNELNAISGALVLTNATTVTATKTDGTVNALTIGFTVLEFYPGVVNSVQQVTSTIAASGTTVTNTITSVNIGNSIVLWNGWDPALFTVSDTTRWPYIALTNSTTLTATRSGASAATSVINSTILEFKSQYIKSKQLAQTQITNGNASATATISAVNTAKSLITWNGFTDNTNDVANPSACYYTSALTNSTTVTLTRGSAATSLITTSWGVLEFI